MVCKCIQLLFRFDIMFDHLDRKSGEIKGRGCAIIYVHCSGVKEKSKQIQIPRKRLNSKEQKEEDYSSFKMAQTTKSQVTLKGSAQMVAEFFNYGINSILYQRGIYPPGEF